MTLLFAKPPIPSSMKQLKSNRFDKFYLYTSPEDKHWRYELTIVDRITSADSTNKRTSITTNPSAVFLIPAGREKEYIFNSQSGLLNIAESAQCLRLIAVGFQRTDCFDDGSGTDNHPYKSQQHVKEELSTTVQLIAQHDGVSKDEEDNYQIPFMAVDDGIGQRNVIARGETTTTGPYIIEEVLLSDQEFVRRLYFMRNPNVIQTEVYMMKDDSRKVNRLKLAFEYHMDIIAGYLLLSKHLPSEIKEEAILIGLGGGGLHNFMDAFFKSQLHITAIELDPGIVSIAKEHFGLSESEMSLNVIVGDGLHVKSLVTSSEDDENSTSSLNLRFHPSSISLIVIDVDSKDTSVGMSCPPMSFISESYLENLKGLLIADGGMLVINVSARDPEKLQEVQRNVSQVFSPRSVFISSDCDHHTNDKGDRASSSEALNVVIFAVLNINCPNIALPKGMDAVDRIYEAFEKYKVFDVELRGAMELCSSKIKQLDAYFNDEALKKTVCNKSKKKKVKGKTRKKG